MIYFYDKRAGRVMKKFTREEKSKDKSKAKKFARSCREESK